MSAVLETVNDGFWTAVTVAPEEAVTTVPFGEVPVVVAVLVTLPAFRSACVVVRVALHVSVAFGASVAGRVTAEPTELVQVMVPSPDRGSLSPTDVSVVFPLLVIAKV